METLNFKALKKQYCPIVLPDEKGTKILLTTPNKSLLEEFIDLTNVISETENGKEVTQELYKLTTKIFNLNINKIKFTRTQIESMFDLEDLYIFMSHYAKFISEITNSKN